MSEFLDHFEAMLARLFPLTRVRAIDAGADWSAERAEFDASGFAECLAAEAAGGAGLSFAEVVPLWRAIGYRAAPLELGQAMVERGGGDRTAGLALLFAGAISGAADKVLDMTAAYAVERVQFGKPIGRQQAVQQQLAVMAEQVLSIRFAVAQAASGSGWPTGERAALAKSVASANAPAIANTAHALHGAIGISAEFDLHLFTRRLHAWRLAEGSETIWAARLGRAFLAANESPLDWVRVTLYS